MLRLPLDFSFSESPLRLAAAAMDTLMTKGPQIVNNALTNLRLVHAFDAAVGFAALLAFVKIIRMSRRSLRTTKLRGPASTSFLYGVGNQITDADDAGAVYEAWAQEYGPVYEAPSTLGRTRIILCDTKAITHFYNNETWVYIQTPVTKILFEGFGKGLFWSHGESHKRQRKQLTPAFSIAAIRKLSSIFYDSAYKAKGAWDAMIESNGGESAIIDVQIWMNHISLDTIGLAGFSHDFGSLDGKRASVTEAFDAFGVKPRSSALNNGIILLALVFPILARLPTPRTKLISRLSKAMEEISNVLLAKTKQEMEMGAIAEMGEKSIIGLLIKGASEDSEFQLTREEVMAQMRVLLLAGYETTSVSLTWALIELCRNPDMQTKLRNELLEHGADPTFDELMHASGLPYLDAVVHETIRLHPPIPEFTRVAIEDDVMPLSEPIRTKSGELVTSLNIAKGTLIGISPESINRSVAIWGVDAKLFKPSRWLEDEQGQDGIPVKAKEIQGHRHILTFADGPRMCIGKNFALSESKAVLAVLVKNFVFELQGGPDAKIEMGRGFLARPKIPGEIGTKLPLRVRPYTG